MSDLDRSHDGLDALDPPTRRVDTRRLDTRRADTRRADTRRRGATAESAPVTRRQAMGKEPRRQKRKRRGGLAGYLREIGIVLLAAVVLSWVVKTFLIQPFWIPSGSMETTLDIGDRVMVSKLTPGMFDLKRGDVVVFKDPGDWLNQYTPPPTKKSTPAWLEKPLMFVGLAPETSQKYLIKRVIGLPGDRVDGEPGKPIKVNGLAIDEPYVNKDSTPNDETFHITVPEGRVWVMGDHRNASGDSRFHDDGQGRTGSVPLKNVVGRAIIVVWPMGNGKWVDDYQAVFAGVPPPPSRPETR